MSLINELFGLINEKTKHIILDFVGNYRNYRHFKANGLLKYRLNTDKLRALLSESNHSSTISHLTSEDGYKRGAILGAITRCAGNLNRLGRWCV